jgi:branched-subunit amino acid aminotransferase/4-amino-4-deoxychorismate lyase
MAANPAAMSAVQPTLTEHVRVIGHRLTWFDAHVERDRRIARHLDLDAMRTGLEIQVLEHTVVVVNHSSVVTVDEYPRIARRVHNPDGTVGASRS